MKERRPAELRKEVFTFRNGRIVRRASHTRTIVLAAKLALHAHPLGNNNVIRLNPFEIIAAVLDEELFELLSINHEILSWPYSRGRE